MKKTNKTSTRTSKRSNAGTPRIKTYEEEYYFDIASFKMVPVSMPYIERLAEEWVEVTQQNEDIITFDQYFILKKISRFTIDKFLNRSEVLRQAKEYVRMIISVRREVGVITKKYEPSFIGRTHSAYDPVFKEIEEWRAKLKEKSQDSGGVRLVEYSRFESVDSVKPSQNVLIESIDEISVNE